jgi:hypothetical protein
MDGGESQAFVNKRIFSNVSYREPNKVPLMNGYESNRRKRSLVRTRPVCKIFEFSPQKQIKKKNKFQKKNPKQGFGTKREQEGRRLRWISSINM